MNVDDLAMHLGQGGVAAAEGDQRELREDERERDQRLVHAPAFRVTKMLTGAITSMVGTSGR